MPRPADEPRPQTDVGQSRLIPLLSALFICLFIATGLGYGAWRLFVSHSVSESGGATQVSPSETAPPTPLPTNEEATPTPSPETTPPETTPTPPSNEGELPVTGGEVALGGDDAGQPLRREFVEPFAIAETEVTNEQYAEFVKASGYKAPTGWRNSQFAQGAEQMPVTGVTWYDAVAFCKWLSEKKGVTVRLPTEAEWELAARGTERFKYPWGNEWNDDAAASKETKGRVEAVKNHPAGKSPCGAYDMAGNVWEWIDKEDRSDSETHKLLKGGAAISPRKSISGIASGHLPANIQTAYIGFRYVVARDGGTPPR